jgi:hypothetical protein
MRVLPEEKELHQSRRVGPIAVKNGNIDKKKWELIKMTINHVEKSITAAEKPLLAFADALVPAVDLVEKP